DRRHLAQNDFAARAIQGDVIAFFDRDRARAGSERETFEVVTDFENGTAGYAALAHSTRDYGGVGSHASACGENTFGDGHATDILWRRLEADQNYLTPLFFHPMFRGFGIENDLAGSGARRRRQTLGYDFFFGFGI